MIKKYNNQSISVHEMQAIRLLNGLLCNPTFRYPQLTKATWQVDNFTVICSKLRSAT